ncbi:hypothetical protein [[Limnothrix rosea] IAM M-220]|uniref:hypothetical protein n=1 Tax=[Limnothrix rosea] IAM M-220 TaxID=454133 RepID=UPI00096315FC|nr:hypothetical protein [[Limnothrix rosea] IAM M-220]OKH18609.1 hypothetical protein NIES208_05220 [[Limnothrix rosea] IAM M-220]
MKSIAPYRNITAVFIDPNISKTLHKIFKIPLNGDRPITAKTKPIITQLKTWEKITMAIAS